MRALVLVLLVAAVGCGAPFAEIKPSVPKSGVAVVYCGSAAASTASIMKAMEPPIGQSGSSGMEEQKVLSVCLRLENHGSEVARLDRSDLELHTPHETDSWEPDSDDQEVIAHPGESKELHVAFHYSPLPSGEDVEVVLDKALLVGKSRVKLAPIGLRKH